MGCRVVLANSMKPEGTKEVDEEVYTLRRLLRGVPEGQDEILEGSALPQENNVDYMGGIDFRKGCYVGQELTIRTHHTGVVRKRVLPVQLYSGDIQPEGLEYDPESRLLLPPLGSNISRVPKKGRSAGKFLSGLGNIGLALCRLEIMTDTILTGEGSAYKREDQFKVDVEGEDGIQDVRIKAFVPSWHKQEIKSPGRRVE
jgi:transferase CAF17, mitochondrial